MGIMSKAFGKLNELGSPKVAKSAPLGALPRRDFGGLVRAKAQEPVEKRVKRASAGDLGSIAKSEMMPPGMSYAPGSVPSVSASERVRRAWVTRKQNAGMAAQPEQVAAKPAAVQSVDHQKVKTEYERNEDENNHSENALLLANTFGTPEEKAEAQQHLSDRDKYGHGSRAGMEFQAKMSEKYYGRLSGAPSFDAKNPDITKSLGKSLGVFGTMQALSKSKK